MRALWLYIVIAPSCMHVSSAFYRSPHSKHPPPEHKWISLNYDLKSWIQSSKSIQHHLVVHQDRDHGVILMDPTHNKTSNDGERGKQGEMLMQGGDIPKMLRNWPNSTSVRHHQWTLMKTSQRAGKYANKDTKSTEQLQEQAAERKIHRYLFIYFYTGQVKTSYKTFQKSNGKIWKLFRYQYKIRRWCSG